MDPLDYDYHYRFKCYSMHNQQNFAFFCCCKEQGASQGTSNTKSFMTNATNALSFLFLILLGKELRGMKNDYFCGLGDEQRWSLSSGAE